MFQNRLRVLRFLLFASFVWATSLLASCTEPATYHATENGKWSNLSANNVAIHGNIWNNLRYNLDLSYDGHEQSVQNQINWLVKNPGYLKKSLQQSAPYIFYIYQETRNKDLPAELALLPILESGYDPFVYSQVGATGLWQMMPGTASGFGLKINWWYDGRRDVIVSTQTALRYLTYLYSYFNNDWLLAIAAYNSGEGRVQAAINYNKKHQLDTDFWSLKLPKQTKAYVIRLLAVAEIVRSSDHYGLNLPAVSATPFVKQVDVGTQIDIKEAAKLAGVDIKVLRALNPGLRRFATDPEGPYTILIPISQADTFDNNLAQLTKQNTIVWQQHLVQSGETISGIAKKYHVNSDLLIQVNNLKQPQQLLIHKTLLIPIIASKNLPKQPPKLAQNDTQTQASNADQDNSDNNTNDDKTPTKNLKETLKDVLAIAHAYNHTPNHITEEKIPGPQQIVHTVKAGETLGKIANHYGVTTRDLTFWNQTAAKKPLTVGKQILIWHKNYGVYSRSKNYITYQVAPGDNLSAIAHKFKISPHNLMAFNSLANANKLKIGEKIKIPRE